jgi:hypothetical protein
LNGDGLGRRTTASGDRCVLDEPERSRIFDRFIEVDLAYPEYRERTERSIAVIELTPRDRCCAAADRHPRHRHAFSPAGRIEQLHAVVLTGGSVGSVSRVTARGTATGRSM